MIPNIMSAGGSIKKLTCLPQWNRHTSMNKRLHFHFLYLSYTLVLCLNILTQRLGSWWGTSWHYEYFYWCGKDGQTPKEFAQTALYDLSMLTYHNKDPKLSPLIETVVESARFADSVGRIVGKPYMYPRGLR